MPDPISRTVLMDAPWDYPTDLKYRGMKGVKGFDVNARYSVLSLAELARLPMRELLGPEGHLWLWTTGPFLFSPDHKIHTLLERWGAKMRGAITWNKGGLPPGYDLRWTTEYLVFAKRGKTRTASRTIPTCFNAPARGHSHKPEYSYQLIEQANPGFPLVELFARRERAPWLTLGQEIDGRDIFAVLEELLLDANQLAAREQP